MAEVTIADIIVPDEFTAYTQVLTEEKSRLIQSGAISRDGVLDGMLSGGGLVFHVPSFNDLAQDADNVSTDTEASSATPNKITTNEQLAVRLSRNQHWASMDLAAALAGPDPMDAIANRVANYWALRGQKALIAMLSGINKDNGVNDSGDYANDIAAVAYSAGVTDFSAEALLDTKLTMGDSMEDLALLMCHSVVYNRMQKNNLIDFIPDARGETNIPTFQGMQVIVDDGMPSGTATVRDDGTAGDAGTYETWIFGPGAIGWGLGAPKVGTEIDREPLKGDGGGREILSSRVEWMFHMWGHAYVGTAPSGGPSNAATTNNLNIATSWNRVYSERKQIKYARLITRES